MTALPTIDTFSSLVDEVIISLQGYGVEVDQIATLVTDITPTSTSIRLDMADAITRGIIEIDNELIFVTGAVNGIASCQLWGRGFKGTAAAGHTAGSAVYVSPTFPKSIVSREINNTIRSVYPQLFAVKTYEFVTDAVHVQYQLPGDVERIISVEWRWLAINGWSPLTQWEAVSGASSTDFASGKYLAFGDPLASGLTVHVTYAAQPTLLDGPGDQYAAVTGLPPSSRDVIAYGAAARLLPWLDSGRLPTDTVSSDQQDQTKPVGGAVTVGREIRSLYQMRLIQEHQSLTQKYPFRTHRVR